MDKKSLYITSAVCSALAFAATEASAKWDGAQKRCYGAALKGKNDCGKTPEGTGPKTATRDCDMANYLTADSEKACMDLIAKNCPQNMPKK